MKRHRPIFLDFDTRARVLETEIEECWNETVKASWKRNRAQTDHSLKVEFGEQRFEQKRQNFVDLGAKPFSIISYHNALFSQARDSFVIGGYYPALTGACALGERILNHLVLELRDDFSATPEYVEIADKKGFSNWPQMIRTLATWGVFDEKVSSLYGDLEKFRHRAIHFNATLYSSLRADSLNAMRTLSQIIDAQFGAFGSHRWFIEGALGACFIKKAYETDPFVRKFSRPQCPLVGIYHAFGPGPQGPLSLYDRDDYEDREIADDEF